MAGHGGARPGAGAPRGGISQTRRLLLSGITRGLAMAGREKGLQGTDDEVAVESVAHIAADLVLSGQGRDVIAILAQASAKSGEEGGSDPKSPLQRAMERMPGLLPGPDVSRAPIEQARNGENPPESGTAPTDPASVARLGQPFFAPQQTLLPPTLDRAPLPGIAPPAAVPVSGRVLEPAGGEGGGPPPPPSTPHPPIPGEEEKF